MKEDEGFVRLDSPRKCLYWAKTTFGWNEAQAREELHLPQKRERKVYVAGGPFVSTGIAELDALLLSLVTPSSGGATAPPVDPELEPDRAGDGWWHWREAKRFTPQGGVRTRIVPSFIKRVVGDDMFHYVYCSHMEPGKIIYTPDAEHGRADRRVLTTVGRYLTKHHKANFTEARIKAIAEEHTALYKAPAVNFALSADKIEWVYQNGPESCMAGKSWGSENPTRVYDGPDTAVAYLLNSSKRVSARTIVNISKTPMTFSRIFGEEALLTAMLTGLGFVSEPGLKGVRLRLAYDVGQMLIVCPYIDHADAVSIEGEFLVVDSAKSSKKWACKNTTGYPTMSRLTTEELPKELRARIQHRFSCSHCALSRTQPEGHEVDSAGGPICTVCLGTYYVRALWDRSGSRRWLQRDQAVAHNGDWLNPGSSVLMGESGFRRSSVSNRWISAEEAVPLANHASQFIARNEGSLTVRGEWDIRSRCYVDPDGGFISAPHAQAKRTPAGIAIYYDPEHLPSCLQRNAKGAIIFVEKETA